MPEKPKKKYKMSPYKKVARTTVQGTVRQIYEFHIDNEGLIEADYIRELIIRDLAALYHINHTGGIVKIKR